MADSRISELDQLAEQPASDDYIEIVDLSDSSLGANGTNKQVTVANFLGGTADAAHDHAASEVTIVDAGGYFTGTDVEAALQELGAGGGGGVAALDDLTDVVITAAASGDILRHNGTNWVDTPGTTHFDVAGAAATVDAALTAHIGDSSAAHAASAVSFSPTGSIAATDVQAAIAEVASEAGGGGSFDPMAADVWFATQFWS